MLRYPIAIYDNAFAISLYPTLLCAYVISLCFTIFHLFATHCVTFIYLKCSVARYFASFYCILTASCATLFYFIVVCIMHLYLLCHSTSLLYCLRVCVAGAYV